MSDISFMKVSDKATPLLLKACATGQHIKKATLTVRKAGQTEAYLKIEMKECLISSYSTGTTNEDDKPTESISLNFAKITFSFIRSSGEVEVLSWSLGASNPT